MSAEEISQLTVEEGMVTPTGEIGPVVEKWHAECALERAQVGQDPVPVPGHPGHEDGPAPRARPRFLG
jgi:hypothetical protein